MLKIKEVIFSSKTSGETDLSLHRITNGNRPLIIDSGQYDPHRANRMLSYISNLMQSTEIEHSKNVRENKALGDNSELITRVSLDEFSFYTKDRPLTLEEYKYLISEVHKLAKNLPSNIHFQLATFPVYWPNGVVQNCSLYVQSPKQAGQEPLIHHMSKTNSSHIDFQYGYMNKGIPCPIPLAGDRQDLDKRCEPGQDCDPNFLLQGTGVALYDINQYKNALRITSANGQMALQVVDICLDHAYGIGKQHLSSLISQLGQHQEHVPVIANHVISSKSIEQVDAHAAATVTHADVLKGKVGKLKPIVAKQAVAIGVGGFGANVQYNIYQSKAVGFLSGNDFDQAIQYNFQGRPVNVNLLYGGTTMLHEIVTSISSNTDLKRTIERIQTLQKYGLSIDIRNDQGFTVREIICRQTSNALNLKDDTLALINLQMANQLGITQAEIIAYSTKPSSLVRPKKEGENKPYAQHTTSMVAKPTEPVTPAAVAKSHSQDQELARAIYLACDNAGITSAERREILYSKHFSQEFQNIVTQFITYDLSKDNKHVIDGARKLIKELTENGVRRGENPAIRKNMIQVLQTCIDEFEAKATNAIINKLHENNGADVHAILNILCNHPQIMSKIYPHPYIATPLNVSTQLTLAEQTIIFLLTHHRQNFSMLSKGIQITLEMLDKIVSIYPESTKNTIKILLLEEMINQEKAALQPTSKVNADNSQAFDKFISKTIIEYKIKNKVELLHAKQTIENQLFDYYLGRIKADQLSEINGLRQKFIDGTFPKQAILEAFKDTPDFQRKIIRHELILQTEKDIAALRLELAFKERLKEAQGKEMPKQEDKIIRPR
ncbi:hypothetical protein Lsai_0299 [Legionella sainthelensi]|uniref:Uncharacterized protein n=1 Tax=Legionella sainthelensi TaxID=28087 RepID=A0A0W0YTI7_9GAMM|nr:hypothetical protein [Legionella sainthelensi]KTD60189.1 hypothetical protein Lsai_0299 [Legionella sainthelensi]VEH32403.1 Uncharacterised protein [Legionella sainthelensi]